LRGGRGEGYLAERHVTFREDTNRRKGSRLLGQKERTKSNRSGRKDAGDLAKKRIAEVQQKRRPLQEVKRVKKNRWGRATRGPGHALISYRPGSEKKRDGVNTGGREGHWGETVVNFMKRGGRFRIPKKPQPKPSRGKPMGGYTRSVENRNNGLPGGRAETEPWPSSK